MNQTQKLDLLLALYITCVVASELMGSKIFTFLGLNASVAIFTLPITFSINDVVSEVAGKQKALSFMKSSLKILLFLFAFNLLALALPAADRFQPTVPAYQEVFGKSQRMIIASLIAFWLSERFDIYIFSKIRKKLGNSKLWLRNNASNFIGQFFDTTIFMFLAFSRPGNFWFIWSLIIPYWLIKCSISVIETPFTYFGVRWLRTETTLSEKLKATIISLKRGE
jgi:queuosine precursor transporter